METDYSWETFQKEAKKYCKEFDKNYDKAIKKFKGVPKTGLEILDFLSILSLPSNEDIFKTYKWAIIRRAEQKERMIDLSISIEGSLYSACSLVRLDKDSDQYIDINYNGERIKTRQINIGDLYIEKEYNVNFNEKNSWLLNTTKLNHNNIYTGYVCFDTEANLFKAEKKEKSALKTLLCTKDNDSNICFDLISMKPYLINKDGSFSSKLYVNEQDLVPYDDLSEKEKKHGIKIKTLVNRFQQSNIN